MGNHHSASHHTLKPRKNVHWKSAGRPAAPGKPDIVPICSDEEPNAVTLRWAPGAHDGGAPLRGYQVECNRLGSAEWIRTSPPIVLRPELVLSGLEPPHRYQFRVAALNAVGRSDYSELSDVLNVSTDTPPNRPPVFIQHLEDITALENDKTEFRVTFTGAPPPSIAWFKDDYEIFSSRRTAIATDESSSVLVFHQTLPSDEGEIRCTATNRSGHAVTRAKLSLEAAPKLRYPRQYEDGLLYEVKETVFLKTTVVGKPTPTIEWRHDGQPIAPNDRIEISNGPKFSVLKIHSAQRSDRGEYQIHAKNSIGEDTAAFLVTITAPPDPPRRVSVTRQVDKSVTLVWEPPEDDGGCRIGNYVVEYYRTGWNVWLKATTSRKTSVTLFDLIEGSEYKFRVKAESPYGMSFPSEESPPVRIPGRAVDMEFLAVESRIINEALTKQEGEERVSPAPRRKRASNTAVTSTAPTSVPSPTPQRATSNEFMLVLYPEGDTKTKAEKRQSFQLDMDSISPPQLSLSAPDISTRSIVPFKALRNAVSSTELLHERAMARFYKAMAMKEEQQNKKQEVRTNKEDQIDIPYKSSIDRSDTNEQRPNHNDNQRNDNFVDITKVKPPEIFIKTDSVEDDEFKFSDRQASLDSEVSDNKWQQLSFEEDYTASTVSTDEEYSDEGSINGDLDRRNQYSNEDETYNPRNKFTRASPLKEMDEEEEEEEDISEKVMLKPLPLPDPNFVPKPILKRRDVPDIKQNDLLVPKYNKKESSEEMKNYKSKKDEKMPILKKITKMPLQKSFPFPKILNKKETEKPKEEKSANVETVNKVNKPEQTTDKITEEGRTIIDYYGNIVKEYGSQKRPTTPLYLNTEDLKTVAEKQQNEIKNETVENKKKKVKKRITKSTNHKEEIDSENINSIHKDTSNKNQLNLKKIQKSNSDNRTISPNGLKTDNKKAVAQQILLKKTERATIVIPINYQELEKKAQINVRSAIDYTVDLCLLMLAFWVYLFKDERLAIPFLILIIYRQLQETILLYIPEWFRQHAPNWLKKKTS